MGFLWHRLFLSRFWLVVALCGSLADMSRTEVDVTEKHVVGVSGPGVGWQGTAGASWNYFDLSSAANRYVRIECRGSDVSLCFVPDQDVSPSTGDTGDSRTDDLAFTMNDGEVEQFVVPSLAHHLAFQEITGGGVIRVHLV